MMNYDTTDLDAAEVKELRRLNGKHRDIREHGADVLAKQLEKDELQIRRQAFVSRYQLSCFLCGATAAEWAAGGKNQWNKLWVICATCVRKPKA